MREKLIRDYIPEIAAAHGDHLVVRTADLDELPALLAQKLIEEVTETNAADDNLLEELADVLEVLHAIAALHGHSPADIERARAAKAAGRGRFERRFVMEIPARGQA